MRIVMAAAVLMAALSASGTASAQTALESRVDRLEKEMRAVQRKLNPGGAPQLVEPQITPVPQDAIPGVPATDAVTDLTARVTAVEEQLANVTGNTEQLQYRVRQLEDAFNAFKRGTDARLKAIEEKLAAAAPAPIEEAPARPARPPATKPADGPAKPDPQRAARIAAIERPTSGDPAQDQYNYGFRLWSAKLYPEAVVALAQVSAKYPQSKWASWARNLQGRALLDDGKPGTAIPVFHENYKLQPNGERAPHSLYYMAKALEAMKASSGDICKVYGELLHSYGDRIDAQMQADVAAGRAAAKCE